MGSYLRHHEIRAHHHLHINKRWTLFSLSKLKFLLRISFSFFSLLLSCFSFFPFIVSFSLSTFPHFHSLQTPSGSPLLCGRWRCQWRIRARVRFSPCSSMPSSDADDLRDYRRVLYLSRNEYLVLRRRFKGSSLRFRKLLSSLFVFLCCLAEIPRIG